MFGSPIDSDSTGAAISKGFDRDLAERAAGTDPRVRLVRIPHGGLVTALGAGLGLRRRRGFAGRARWLGRRDGQFVGMTKWVVSVLCMLSQLVLAETTPQTG